MLVRVVVGLQARLLVLDLHDVAVGDVFAMVRLFAIETVISDERRISMTFIHRHCDAPILKFRIRLSPRRPLLIGFAMLETAPVSVPFCSV